MVRPPVLIVGFASVALGLGALLTPPEVNACQLHIPEPDERTAQFVESAEAVVVGVVVAEEADQSPSGHDAFRSTLQIVATLSGKPPGDLELANLGYLSGDCSGGPRLPEGDRFLLFLTTQPSVPMGNGHLPVGEWRVAALGMATYLLDEGEAWFAPLGFTPERESAIAVDAFIRDVGEALGSEPAEVDRAIVFASGGALPPRASAESESSPVALWGSAGVTLTAIAILGGWYLRGRSRRGL